MPDSEMKQRGQDAAAAFLERVGICVVERNWRCDAGTADIIAWDGNTLTIASVRIRKSGISNADRVPSEAARRRITRVADCYALGADLGDVEWRYDLIDIRVIAEDRALLRHFRGALDGRCASTSVSS
jgi:putative endonuclease